MMPTSSHLWALPPDSALAALSGLSASLNAPPAHQAAFGEAREKPKGYTVQNGVAVIPVTGSIWRSGYISSYSGQVIVQGQDMIAAALDAALADRSVKAVLFSFNSPGGVVAGTKELGDRIAAAAKIKPMASYADGLMASAAFWLGAATGRVYAPVTATVGSIGILWVHTDFSKMNDKYGLSFSYITGGKWKAAGNPDNPLTDEDRAYFQRQVSQLHEIFKADVIRGLGVTASAETWAEGQTMLAEEAKAVGLVTTIVRDLASAITTLSLEATMDLKTLAAQHPELLADIQKQAKAEALQEAEAKAKTTTEEATASVLAIVKAVGSEELHAHVTRLVQAGATPTMIEAMAPLMAKAPEAAPQSKEEAAKAAILAGINAATPAPVPGAAPEKNEEAEARAAIERMSKL